MPLQIISHCEGIFAYPGTYISSDRSQTARAESGFDTCKHHISNGLRPNPPPRFVQAVDHIARYENFSAETQHILNNLGIKYENKDFNHRFRQTNREKDYRKYYKDDATIETVSKHFSSDLETFGDKF